LHGITAEACSITSVYFGLVLEMEKIDEETKKPLEPNTKPLLIPIDFKAPLSH
jgi:hypothetical protein